MRSGMLFLSMLAIGFFCLCKTVDASVLYDDYQLTLPQLRQSNGSLTIMILKDGDWQYQGRLNLDKYYREKHIQLNLGDNPADQVHVKLIQDGGGSTHIDVASLGGWPPHAMVPQISIGLTKLAAKDFDVLHGFDHSLELVFDNPDHQDLFSITARIEAERLDEIPFQLPLTNLYKKMSPESQFWSYPLNSNRAPLNNTLPLDTMGKSIPFFKEHLKAGSGHPSDYVYGWVQNDDDNLYVIMDLTGDNTMDGEKDYAKVYVNTPDGLKSFKITQSENHWGEPYFTYTDKVVYQHKVYAFRIPFEDIGYNPAEMGDTLELAFAAYGTLAPPVFSKTFNPATIGPGSVSTLRFTLVNGNPLIPVNNLAFIDTFPLGMTIANLPNGFTDCGVSPILSTPAGGDTISFSDGQLGAGQSCIVTVDVTSSTPGIYNNVSGDLNSDAGNSGTAAADLTVATTLPGFTKSFVPSTILLGSRSTLTFTINNTANTSPVGSLEFTDNLPNGMVIADPANGFTDCVSDSAPDTTLTVTPGSSVVILDANGSTLFPGFEVLAAMATCTVTVDVRAIGVGMLNNSSGELLADFVTSGKANAPLEVTTKDLTLVKSFTNDPVPPGDTVTLEFTIHNLDRDFSATDIAFTDDLTTTDPALAGLTFSSLLSNDCGGLVTGVGTTAIGFSGGTVSPQASCIIRTSLSVPAGALPGVYTNTTGTITGIVDGLPIVGNEASEDLHVEPIPLLTKEFLEDNTLLPDPVITPGDDVVIRFTITNTSTTSGATDITFVDELTDGGPNTGFLPFPVSVVPPPLPCGAGSSLALIGLDTDRQGLQLTGGTLAPSSGAGSTCTFDVTVTVPAGMPSGIYTNTTGEITAMVDGATRIGGTASDTLTVISAPQLTKVFTDDPVAPGGTVTLEFTLTYPADASGDATGITFTDNLAPVLDGLTGNLPPNPDPPCGAGSSLTGSAGGTLLTLENGVLVPGESCTFSLILDVPADASPGSYANTTSAVDATVQGEEVTSSAASDDLMITGLVLSKEFLGDPVLPGDTVTLRFTIDNIHPTEDASITLFTDDLAATLPGLAVTGPTSVDTCGGALSWTTVLEYAGGSVMSGQSCTIEVEVQVPAGATDGDYINVTSSLFATQGDPVTIDPAVDTLTVNSNLLQLTKLFTDDPVSPGDAVTLEFTLTNLDATQAVMDIDFTDGLGAALAGLTFDSVVMDTCGGDVSGLGTDLITVVGASLSADGTCTLRTSLSVPLAASPNIYTNTTSGVTGTMGGFAVSGDAASDDLEVLNLLGFTKSFDGSTTATGTATLTFNITNPNADTAMDISFSDNLADMIPGLIATGLPTFPCGAGSSISGSSFLVFSGGELPPGGGQCAFDVEVLVPVTASGGVFVNTTSDLTTSGLKVADPATANLTIEPPPTFSKVFAPDIIIENQSSTLTFTIDNTASSLTASRLDFTDNLPAGVVVATPANASTTCSGGTLMAVGGTGVISYTGGTVSAGATCTIETDITSSAPGMSINTTGELTSSSGNSGTASATLSVEPLPSFSKTFVPNTIPVGGTSTLIFAIDNSGSSQEATNLDFTDNLPAGVDVATPANAFVTCTGGILTASSDTSTIAYTGGTVISGAACTVVVDVISSDAGIFTNITGDLTSSFGNSGSASDILVVEGDFPWWTFWPAVMEAFQNNGQTP